MAKAFDQTTLDEGNKEFVKAFDNGLKQCEKASRDLLRFT